MTRGAEQLKAYLAGRGEQAKFVEKYNKGRSQGERIDAPTVSRWVSGKRVPLIPQAKRIELLTEIPMQAWAEPSKRPTKGAA